jgi:hypothetical protein
MHKAIYLSIKMELILHFFFQLKIKNALYGGNKILSLKRYKK